MERSEGVIVVVDASRNGKNVDALEWAIYHVVRPRDNVLLLGVLIDFGKKNYSCFPLISNIGISGIWEKLEFSSGHGEVNPRQLEEKLEMKRVQYQNDLEKFHRQCKRNEVKLEVKLAAGYCPAKLAVDEAQKTNTRWIVLDSHFKKYHGIIRQQVGCKTAIMKRKDIATLMPLTFPLLTTRTYPPKCNKRFNQRVATNGHPGSHGKNPEREPNSSAQQPQTPHWYLLSWRSGFPRAFTLRELEEMTEGFADENLIQKSENLMVYEGIFQETLVLIKSFQENDDRFWSVLVILSRARHRNIMNLVGYCFTGSCRFIIFDFPCLGTLACNLDDDELARKLTWKVRWYIAMEIGGSLRYLHEECGDGPIVHQSVCSANIVLSRGCCAMLCNFITAKWLNVHESSVENKKDEELYVDVRDYGIFLVELIAGQNAKEFAEEKEGQSLVDWAVPLIKDGKIEQVMDPRLMDGNSDKKMIQYMAKASLLCLESPHPRPSISKVLAVVRGDRLAISKCSL